MYVCVCTHVCVVREKKGGGGSSQPTNKKRQVERDKLTEAVETERQKEIGSKTERERGG